MESNATCYGDVVIQRLYQFLMINKAVKITGNKVIILKPKIVIDFEAMIFFRTDRL